MALAVSTGATRGCGSRCALASHPSASKLRIVLDKKTVTDLGWRKKRIQEHGSTQSFQSLAARAGAAQAGRLAAEEGGTQLFATFLGYCVLLGSLFRSVPQIIRIVRNRSVEGLSLTSFVTELIAYSITWAYNLNLGYPFSTYGDVVACWLQDLILVVLILQLRKQIDLKVLLGSVLFAVFTGVLMTNTCGSQALVGLQASTILIMSFGARLPQIVMNYQRGNSGELSLITCVLNVMGCITRMFTTFVLTKDMLNFAGTSLQLVLNGVLLYQTLMTARATSGVDGGGLKLA